VGIDVQVIVDRPDDFEASTWTPSEQSLLSRWSGPARAEWAARFRCARQAAARAAGMGQDAGSSSAEVVHVDEDTGVLQVRIAPALPAAYPDRLVNPLRVISARRGEHAWAGTLAEGAES
jgi:hypothetical protein